MELQRVRAVISGRVQGVGFRYYLQRRGLELGLAGWVRNRGDGSVEFVAEGPRPAIEKLLAAARMGPPSAYVTDMRVEWSPPEGNLPQPFSIESTSWS
ncbi:MAG: acylphosphatase [Armatimonadota bacterium]